MNLHKLNIILKIKIICLLLISFQNHLKSQDTLKKTIRNNEVEIQTNISELLSSSTWTLEYTGRKKRKRVKKIRKNTNSTTWTFNNNSSLNITGTNSNTKKKWSNDLEIIIFPSQNTFMIRYSEFQIKPYKIIKASDNILVFQEIDRFKYDQNNGVILTIEELKRRSEARGEMLFGGRQINIGKPSFERILLKRKK